MEKQGGEERSFKLTRFRDGGCTVELNVKMLVDSFAGVAKGEVSSCD